MALIWISLDSNFTIIHLLCTINAICHDILMFLPIWSVKTTFDDDFLLCLIMLVFILLNVLRDFLDFRYEKVVVISFAGCQNVTQLIEISKNQRTLTQLCAILALMLNISLFTCRR